jgi:hypothetical protein
VFLDWRELYTTAEQKWDRLCDHLKGRGVPNLEDALVNLELAPVHDALEALLDPGVVRLYADLAEHPRPAAVGTGKNGIERERREFFEQIWQRCEGFFTEAQRAYGKRTAGALIPDEPLLLGYAFQRRLREAMQIPALEAHFAKPWSQAARRVLPSPSPQLTATAMWGPVIAWIALEVLAESFDAEKPGKRALDIFDRLRLRESFGRAFTALGFEGEEAWKVVSRIKVGLLTGAGVGKPPVVEVKPEAFESFAANRSSVEKQALKVEIAAVSTAKPAIVEAQAAEVQKSVKELIESPLPKQKDAEEPVTQPTDEAADMDEAENVILLTASLWEDPDVRWLTGVHQTEGSAYVVREQYEELLWWLRMPELLRMAGEKKPDKKELKRIGESIHEALASAEVAGYRLDHLMGLPEVKASVEIRIQDELPTVESAEPEA